MLNIKTDKTRPAGRVARMAKIVQVTSTQVNAAKLKIKRSAASGKSVSPSVIAIANARRATNRSELVPGP